MNKINLRRLLLGGFLAGFVVVFITGFANGVLLNGSFQEWATGMGSNLHPPSPPNQVALWILMGLLDGFIGVWIYVAARPRYGAGAKTALLAGLFVWIIGRLCVAFDLIALGIFPIHIMVAQGIVGLVAIMSGVFVGSWVYKE